MGWKDLIAKLLPYDAISTKKGMKTLYTGFGDLCVGKFENRHQGTQCGLKAMVISGAEPRDRYV